MEHTVRRLIDKSFRAFGVRVTTLKSEALDIPIEFSKRDVEILDYVLNNNLTMVSRRRLIATIMACKYVVSNGIEGDFTECGVWRGGNSIAAKLVFESCGDDRTVVLFDTFAGMTEPTDADRLVKNDRPAIERFRNSRREGYNEWCYASLENVRQNFIDAGTDISGVRFVQGDVADTLSVQANLPKKISVLRLDTDWYESTKTEMEVLYPLVEKRGVLIVDDYGYWQGARKAVEEYFVKTRTPRPLMQYTDRAGRMGIK